MTLTITLLTLAIAAAPLQLYFGWQVGSWLYDWATGND